jgi:hypothetical protein
LRHSVCAGKVAGCACVIASGFYIDDGGARFDEDSVTAVIEKPHTSNRAAKQNVK